MFSSFKHFFLSVFEVRRVFLSSSYILKGVGLFSKSWFQALETLLCLLSLHFFVIIRNSAAQPMNKSCGSYVCANFLRAVRARKGKFLHMLFGSSLLFSHSEPLQEHLGGRKQRPQNSSLWGQLWGGGGADIRHIYGLMESLLPHPS